MCWLCDLHRLYTDLHRLCGLPFSEFVVLFLCNAQRSDILNVKQRKQLRRKGAHCIRTFFFSTGLCENETESERDTFFGQKYLEFPYNRGAGGLPQRRSDARTATRTALHFGGPGARHGKVLFDARPERSRHRALPAQEQSPQVGQRSRRRPDASSEQTGTMGQLYSYDAFFSYHIIVYFTAGVAGVFCTLRHMWKAWCKQKKKVWVHGLMQRAPRLVGSSRENKTQTYL